jgi:hypothetical protein
MSIQHIGNSRVPAGLSMPEHVVDALASRGTPETIGTSSKGEVVDRANIAPLSATLHQAMQVHERDNAAAQHIRTKDEAMKAIGDTLDKMSADLEAVVKQYPPFPRGSEERVQRLRSYAGLRAEIDRLTTPPHAEEAGTLRAGRKTDESAAPVDKWVLAFDSQGKTMTVPKEEVRMSPSGLHLPVLDPPETIDDLAIHDALDKLDAAQRRVSAERDQLHAASQLVRPAPMHEGDAMPTDEHVKETSAAVREDLAGRPLSIASGGHAQFEQLLG